MKYIPVMLTLVNLFRNVITTKFGWISSSLSEYRDAPITPEFKISSPKSPNFLLEKKNQNYKYKSNYNWICSMMA